MLAVLVAARAVDRDELAVVVEVVLLEVAVEQLDDLGRVHEPAAARGDDPLRAVVERLQRLGGRLAELDGDAAAGRVEHPQHAVLAVSMRRRSWTSSSPSPVLMRAKRLMTALASAGAKSTDGQA